jgi:hypothetical protein
MTDQDGEAAELGRLTTASPEQASRDQLRALLGDAVADDREALDGLVSSLLGPTARVIMPRQEDMSLRLVSEQAIRRLDESRSTSRFLFTVMATAIGGVVGFVTNVVTSGQDVDGTAWAFLLLLGLVALATGIYGSIVEHRERSVLKAMLDGG